MENFIILRLSECAFNQIQTILTDYALFLRRKGMLMPVDTGVHLKKAKRKWAPRQQMAKL